MAYQLGRTSRVFIKEESSYGAAPTLAATDAVRHTMARLNVNPANRADIDVRTTHPSVLASYRASRRKTGTWNVAGIFFPSGTLGVSCDHEPVLEHGLGTKKYTALATTVSASPAPSTTVFTVASATGLAVGDAVLVACSGGLTPGKYVRWVTAIDTLALTVAPALPQAPASGDAIKAVINYKLASDLAKSLDVARYWDGLKYEGLGCVVDSLKFGFDANTEPTWDASGPLATRTRPGQTEPGAFTVVGTQPPSGLTTTLRLGAAAENMVGAEFTIANGMDLDNYNAGSSVATGFYRKDKRKVSLTIKQLLTGTPNILDAAEAVRASDTVLVQCGDTEGKIVAVWCPSVEFSVPDDVDNIGTNEITYAATALATAGNDEFYIAVA